MPTLALLAVASACAACWLDGEGVAGSPAVIRDTVDLVEVNHFFDENGRHVFDQVIFYDWCDTDCRFNVLAWRLMKTTSQFPFRDRRSIAGGYLSIWTDGDWLRHVRAAAFRETWTQADPELAERQHLAREHRRELGRPRLPAAASSGVPEPP